MMRGALRIPGELTWNGGGPDRRYHECCVCYRARPIFADSCTEHSLFMSPGAAGLALSRLSGFLCEKSMLACISHQCRLKIVIMPVIQGAAREW